MGIVRRPPWMKRPSLPPPPLFSFLLLLLFFFRLFPLAPPPRHDSILRYPRVARLSFLRNRGLMREGRGVPRRWGRGSSASRFRGRPSSRVEGHVTRFSVGSRDSETSGGWFAWVSLLTLCEWARKSGMNRFNWSDFSSFFFFSFDVIRYLV